MGVDLAALLKLVAGALDLEKKIEAALAAEKNAKKRKALAKACAERDLEKIKELLYDVD